MIAKRPGPFSIIGEWRALSEAASDLTFDVIVLVCPTHGPAKAEHYR